MAVAKQLAMVRVSVTLGTCLVLFPLTARAADAAPSVPVAPAPAAASAPASSPTKARTFTYDRNLPLRIGLVVAGSSFLALSYGVPCAKAGGHWCIPYAGPIIAAVKYNESDAQSENEDGIIPPLFVDSLLVGVSAVQLLSTGLLVAGIVIPKREVTESAMSTRLGRHLVLTPVAGPRVFGLVASGEL